MDVQSLRPSAMVEFWAQELIDHSWNGTLFLTVVDLLSFWFVAQWVISWLTESPEKTASASNQQHRTLEYPPDHMPILGDLVGATRRSADFYDWLVELAERFDGRPFAMHVLGTPQGIFLNTPEHFEDVLKTHFENFEKAPIHHRNLGDLLGHGIFATDGLKWVHQRKTASNLFTMNALRTSMASVAHKNIHVMNRIFNRAAASGEPLSIVKLMNKFTLETFAEIGFGIQLGCLEAPYNEFEHAFDTSLRILSSRFIRPDWFWSTMRFFNVGLEGELKRHIQVIDEAVFSIISQSIENRELAQQNKPCEPVAPPKWTTSQEKNLVTLFLDNASNDSESEVDPVFLRDIVVNFVIAGRDTTAQLMSWFFYCLSQHPRVEEKLCQELQLQLPELMAGEISAPTLDQVAHLTYLEATLKETLRLYPPVPSNMKRAIRDTVLSDGTFVKKGSVVVYSSYVEGRLKSVWGEDAKRFNPERWIDFETGKLMPVSAFKFSSFNAGPRMCLGMNMAMTETKIVVASVLSRFRLALVPSQRITYDSSITLPVKGPMLMRVLPVAQVKSVAMLSINQLQ